MTSLTLLFFSQGVDHPDIAKYLSAKTPPYTVSRTLEEVRHIETSLTAVQNEPLQNRVIRNPRSPDVAVVDKLFQVQVSAQVFPIQAIKVWEELRSGSRTIGILSGAAVVGLILLSLQDLPLDIVVALYVSAVAACCFAGWSLKKYHEAEKELAVWQSPAEDFAQRRKASFELPLNQMSLKKCHFQHEKQPEGTLLGAEILFIFNREYQRFAERLLAKECNTPELKKQWVMEFFEKNPLAIRFFKDNPHLKDESGWNHVQMFQQQFDQLVSLHKEVLDQFETDKEAAKKMHDGILKDFEDKAPGVFKDLKIVPLEGNYYKELVLPDLKEECLDKIRDVYTQHSKELDDFYPKVYLQMGSWLAHAHKILKGEPSIFDDKDFAHSAKFLPSEFKPKLDAVTAGYRQKVIAKAKEKAPDNVKYCAFVDAVFKP